jgi:hypothetical protein
VQSDGRPRAVARVARRAVFQSSATGLSAAVRATTTSGTGGRVDPTSNDAGDPSPIAALFANADHGAVAPAEAAALRFP